MQHDWTHVERPGESHTALDGKKVFVSQRTCYATMPHEGVPMNTKGVDIQLYLLGFHSHVPVPVAVSANWPDVEAASL